MNKIIKTYHTPFWNPLETFSSWIRSIRAKVEKQLPHINTLWVFSLCLNLRTLPAIEKSLQLRRAELDEQDKQEFLVWLKENSSYQIFIQLLGEQQQANMFIIWSPFSRANSTEAFGNHACMHLKWRKVGSRKMIMSAFFFLGLENLIDVNASYSRIFLWLWLCPYRCLFSSKRCTQFLLTKNTSNVSRAFVFNSALDVHTWATRDRSIL